MPFSRQRRTRFRVARVRITGRSMSVCGSKFSRARVCTNAYVCLYIYIHVHVYTYIHIYIHICIPVYEKFVYTYVYMTHLCAGSAMEAAVGGVMYFDGSGSASLERCDVLSNSVMGPDAEGGCFGIRCIFVVCIHIYMYINMYLCIHIYKHIQMDTNVYLNMYLHVCIYIYI